MAKEPRHETGKPAKSSKSKSGKKIVSLTLLGEKGKKTASFRLDKERIVLGAVISADVRLSGSGVAPIHAVLEAGGAEPMIYDLASETGVFVNGKKTVTQALSPGDEITIGLHKLKFALEDSAAVSPKEILQSSEGKKLFVDPEEDVRNMLLDETREIQEIFDYRPSSKPAIEVLMSWNETVLAADHFVREREITIGGSRSCHFGIPPVLGKKKFTLVSRQGENFYLNLDPRMKGVMQRRGELQALDEIRKTSMAGGDHVQVPIERDDFAKLSIGGIDFYLSFTAAPPRLKRSRMLERDPLLFKVVLGSLLFTTLTVTGLLSARVPQTLEAEQIPDRIASVLYQPEKYAYHPRSLDRGTEAAEEPKKPEPAPKPTPLKTVKIELTHKAVDLNKKIPKEMDVGQQHAKTIQQGKKTGTSKNGGEKAQSQAKEGAGARAKGKEGERGSKTAKANIDKQHEAKRPSAVGGAGKGGGKSQILNEGNVDFLKGASGRIQDILGGSSAKLGKGGEKLKGFGGFATLGGGGLALSGNGKGGGGDAESLGGLANKGKGGGRIGTGVGAAGNGTGIIGGKARVSIRSGGPEEAVILGSIDEDAVNAAIERHRDEFRLCYEREINASNPGLAGSVSTNFVIGSSGRVTQAGLESSTLKHPATERCVLNVLKRIEFPTPRGGGIVQVKKSFKFRPQGRA